MDYEYVKLFGMASIKESMTATTETEEKILGIVNSESPVLKVKQTELGESVRQLGLFFNSFPEFIFTSR